MYYICISFIRHQAPKCKYYTVVSQPFLVLCNHHLKHNFTNSENNLETSMPICLFLQEDIMNHKLCGLSNHRARSAPRWAWKALSLFFFFFFKPCSQSCGVNPTTDLSLKSTGTSCMGELQRAQRGKERKLTCYSQPKRLCYFRVSTHTWASHRHQGPAGEVGEEAEVRSVFWTRNVQQMKPQQNESLKFLVNNTHFFLYQGS